MVNKMKTKEQIEKRLKKVMEYIEKHEEQLLQDINKEAFIAINVEKVILEWVLKGDD